MNLSLDQFADILNNLKYPDITQLCQSNAYYAKICREDRYKTIIQKKYSEHKKVVENGLNYFAQIVVDIRIPTTITYTIDANHRIDFNIKIIRTREMIDNFPTQVHSITVVDVVEQARNMPLNEYILAQLFISKAKITLDQLLNLSHDDLIKVEAKTEDYEFRQLGETPSLTIEERIRGIKQIPEEYFNRTSALKYILKVYGFEIDDAQLVLNKPTDEQIRYILRNIYTKNTNPTVRVYD